MNTYIKVDENGNLTSDLRILRTIDIAIQNGVSGDAFDENTYVIPTGWARIIDQDPPALSTLTKYNLVRKSAPVKNSAGEFTTEWIIEDGDADRKKLVDGIITNEARRSRNVLLSASDWTQLADAPLTSEQKAAWTTYRQALRDITESAGFPIYHEMPEAPR